MSNNFSSSEIHIKGARVHNLKNLELKLPRNRFIVITGISGSGKSSLAYDTLYAEGQRRYVESLSAYARQFLGRIHKPEVDFIKGIPPAIAIEQKVNTRNPRSTVGTSTEIYDYLKLLFARIGRTISPISGEEVKRHQVSDVVNFICSFPEKSRVIISSPLRARKGRTILEEARLLLQQGFSRIETKDGVQRIDKFLEQKEKIDPEGILLIIDRLMINQDGNMARMADSVQTAFFEGNGECIIKISLGEKISEEKFSNVFEADGIEFEEPVEHMFSFNNPVGACPNCEGYGKVIGIDEDLVIPNKSLSVYQDAVACWRGESMKKWKHLFIERSSHTNFPIHKAYYELTQEQKELLWKGGKGIKGIDHLFRMLETKSYKIQYRVMLSRYRGKTSCPQCKGTRLKKEAGYVKIHKHSIPDLVVMPINELIGFFTELELTNHEKSIAKRILVEIRGRLQFLEDVGLSYLTLNRLSSTLSGGESQRINLATSLGSSLVGSLYILDEPSIGLHPKDTELLISVLRKLQKAGNTVLVVEHDEDIIRASDEIVDIGPKAGINGGELIYQGNYKSLFTNGMCLTADYLNGVRSIEVPKNRRKWNNFIEVIGARENNLRNITAKFPLNTMTVVTGVSGSGKSTLVDRILYPAIMKRLGGYANKTGEHDRIIGDFELISNVELVDQNPIGKSSRSNPVTYLKAYDEIRKLFSELQASKYQGFRPSHFSFNVDGGRCEECQGEGEIKVEMQFMADVHLLCESCKGRRFKEEILDVEYKGKNIHDILELTVNQAIEMFNEGKISACKRIARKLKPLEDVGLGYVKLGQSSSTLSGGESQRVKLASFLSKERGAPSLFIFDEPTTGLHFHDVKKLLSSLNMLISRGNSIVIVEHNLEIIKSADWIIDLGPGGGKHGGRIVFEGTPEELANCSGSHTGAVLSKKLYNADN